MQVQTQQNEEEGGAPSRLQPRPFLGFGLVVNYMQLVFASLVGWAVFTHMPESLSLLGMVVLVASGLMIAIKARLEEKRMKAHLLRKS